MKLALDIGLVVTSVLLIVLVLLHRGKGGGLSSLFGGGVQSSLSGSSVVERNLDRLTVFVGVIWLIFILGIGLDSNSRNFGRHGPCPRCASTDRPEILDR